MVLELENRVLGLGSNRFLGILRGRAPALGFQRGGVQCTWAISDSAPVHVALGSGLLKLSGIGSRKELLNFRKSFYACLRLVLFGSGYELLRLPACFVRRVCVCESLALSLSLFGFSGASF